MLKKWAVLLIIICITIPLAACAPKAETISVDAVFPYAGSQIDSQVAVHWNNGLSQAEDLEVRSVAWRTSDGQPAEGISQAGQTYTLQIVFHGKDHWSKVTADLEKSLVINPPAGFAYVGIECVGETEFAITLSGTAKEYGAETLDVTMDVPEIDAAAGDYQRANVLWANAEGESKSLLTGANFWFDADGKKLGDEDTFQEGQTYTVQMTFNAFPHWGGKAKTIEDHLSILVSEGFAYTGQIEYWMGNLYSLYFTVTPVPQGPETLKVVLPMPTEGETFPGKSQATVSLQKGETGTEQTRTVTAVTWIKDDDTKLKSDAKAVGGQTYQVEISIAGKTSWGTTADELEMGFPKVVAPEGYTLLKKRYQEKGTYVLTFQVGVIKADVGADHSHTFDGGVTSALATCTSDGIRTFYCKECGVRYDEIVPAMGHDWNGSTIKEPTCAETGIVRYTCSRCGATKDETLPKTNPHDLGFNVQNWEDWDTGANYHYLRCRVCGIRIQEACDFGNWEPTCRVCGDQHH